MWGSLFCMGVLLWFLFCICGTLFLGIASACLFLSKHLSLVTMIAIMFLWKPLDHFLMTVLFYLHGKNILNLNSFEYCLLFINNWFSYIFSGLSKSSYLPPFYLSILIDNAIWHARVDVLFTLKSIYNKNNKHQKASLFTHFTAVIFLFYYISLT